MSVCLFSKNKERAAIGFNGKAHSLTEGSTLPAYSGLTAQIKYTRNKRFCQDESFLSLFESGKFLLRQNGKDQK